MNTKQNDGHPDCISVWHDWHPWMLRHADFSLHSLIWHASVQSMFFTERRLCCLNDWPHLQLNPLPHRRDPSLWLTSERGEHILALVSWAWAVVDISLREGTPALASTHTLCCSCLWCGVHSRRLLITWTLSCPSARLSIPSLHHQPREKRWRDGARRGAWSIIEAAGWKRRGAWGSKDEKIYSRSIQQLLTQTKHSGVHSQMPIISSEREYIESHLNTFSN